MTYREKIQEIIQSLQNDYDQVQALRDYADLDEKELFNICLSNISKTWAPLQKLDNHLSASRASMNV